MESEMPSQGNRRASLTPETSAVLKHINLWTGPKAALYPKQLLVMTTRLKMKDILRLSTTILAYRHTQKFFPWFVSTHRNPFLLVMYLFPFLMNAPWFYLLIRTLFLVSA